MQTKKVTEKILEDAKREAQEILDKYKGEAENLMAEYQKRIEERKGAIKQEIKTIKDAEIQRAISTRRLEIKKNLVSEKQKFINTVVNDALKNVPKHKDYLKFLQDLIRKTNERDGELFLTKADYTKLGKRLKDFLKKEGFCYTLKTTNEIKGGLIIKKGKLTYLCSIDMISEILRNSLAIDVSRILFKEVVNGNS